MAQRLGAKGRRQPITGEANRLGCNDEIGEVAEEKHERDRLGAHRCRNQILQQSERRTKRRVGQRDEDPQHFDGDRAGCGRIGDDRRHGGENDGRRDEPGYAARIPLRKSPHEHHRQQQDRGTADPMHERQRAASVSQGHMVRSNQVRGGPPHQAPGPQRIDRCADQRVKQRRLLAGKSQRVEQAGPRRRR